jgi:hypothetical protein
MPLINQPPETVFTTMGCMSKLSNADARALSTKWRLMLPRENRARFSIS